jgi:TPP-dependent pyruvate/acetoin dehydrogenase alpha subunit
VEEVTQPQGHSTSGSHERYKSEERLQWETEHDGLLKFKQWISNYSIEIEGETHTLATWEELDLIDKEAKKTVKEGQKRAWEDYRNSIDDIRDQALPHIEALAVEIPEIKNEIDKFKSVISLGKKMFSI